MSRIPKFGFGFKKAKGQSIDEAPPVDATPPPPEQETTMKRSKSLRVPRSVARSTYFTPTNDQSDPEPQPTSHLQPAVVSRSGAASNPGSRAASPYVAQPPDEDPQRNTVVVSPTEILPPSSRQRTTSLSAKQGAHTRSRSVVLKATRGTGGVGGGQPPPIVLGRSKTPTATTRLGSAPLRKLTRTNSVENTLSAEQSTSPTPTKTVVKSPMTRTDSSGTTNGHVTTPLSRNGSETKLGKVSRVLAMGEGAADLNKLASEFSESLSSSGQEDVDGAYMSRAGPLANSSIRHSPSPSGGLSDSSPTSPSSQTATSRSLLPPPRSSAGGPPRGLEASSSRSRLVVPSIKVGTTTTAQGSTSRPGSAKAFYSVQVSAHPDAAGPPTADPLPPPPLPTSSSGVARSTSDGSTPSSGRNTPADLRGSLELEGSTKSSVSVEETSKGATTTVAEVTPPPRTPYRVPKVRTAFAGEGGGADHTGLNDLEGSVLLEAEDYRRIAQEVKALKTTLLRFKRELQNEVSGIPPSTPANTKVERDKSQEEIASLQKESKAKDAKVDTLSAEVSQLRADNLKLAESLKELEAHRNGLLEKVERLHADKHKLEDRLNCLENARFYELSESMCVESLQEEDLDGSLLMMDDGDDLGEVSNSDINGEDAGSGSILQT